MPWFKIEMEVDVTDAGKARNGCALTSDEDYIRAALEDLNDGRFAFVEIQRIEQVE